jgi:hypothetical protein
MKLENTQSLDRMAEATANRAEMTMMDCLECKRLQRAFEIRLIRYNQARSAAFYRVSSDLAAKQNVAMERAKSDLEEHNLVCSFQQPS